MVELPQKIINRLAFFLLRIFWKLHLPTWRAPPKDHAVYLKIGRKNSLRLFLLELKYHSKILNEKDPKKRYLIYTEAYSEAYRRIRNFLPDNYLFGYDENFIKQYTGELKNNIVIDYGCGFGYSTLFIAKYARKVFGIDCAPEAIKYARKKFSKKNMEFWQIANFILPFKSGTVDFVYSNDLLEHLHPDDLFVHLREIFRVLKSGGKYLFWTPGKSTGPHDITDLFYPKNSGFQPLGLHLKEYDFNEMIATIRSCGFSHIYLKKPFAEVAMMVQK